MTDSMLVRECLNDSTLSRFSMVSPRVSVSFIFYLFFIGCRRRSAREEHRY